MNVFVIGGEKEYWQDVFILLKQNGINIHSALVHYYHEGKGPRKFYNNFEGNIIDGLKFFNLKEISKLIPPEHYILDKKTLEDFVPIERDFYTMTDRFCYFPVSFRHRKRLFRQCLRFWLSYFTENKIDILFIPLTPHSISDFTCYHAAKYLEIPTINLAHSAINDHVFIRHDYRERLKVSANYQDGKTEDELKNEIPELLWQKAFKEISNNIKFVLKRNDEIHGTQNLEGGPYADATPEEMRKSKRPLIIFKPSFKAAFAVNGDFSPLFRKALKLRDYFWFKKQQSFHNSLAKQVDLTQKYIYFAMHFQPEQTSCPETEMFEDQLLAIEILHAALPQGWKLYVKENPIQFDPKANAFTGRHARDLTDYQDLMRLPNLEIIDQKMLNKEVIKNAQIVSTLAGTVGWEAMNEGVPCIIFANAWYSACQSAFEVNSIETAKIAIESAQKKSSANVREDVVKYLHFMKDRYFVGHLGDHYTIALAGIEWDSLVQSMVQRLKKEFEQVSKIRKPLDFT